MPCALYDGWVQALTLWRAEGDKAAYMVTYEYLGALHFLLGEHLRSIECYVQVPSRVSPHFLTLLPQRHTMVHWSFLPRFAIH